MTLTAHNNWATDRILSSAKRLSPEQFVAPSLLDPGWGSVRGTLVHMLGAEQGWRSRMQYGLATPDLVEADFSDIASLVMRWESEHCAWQRYLLALSDAQINGVYVYRSSVSPHPERTFRVWHTLMHVLNHNIHHRAEVAAMLTSYACSPGELDFGAFLREHPEWT